MGKAETRIKNCGIKFKELVDGTPDYTLLSEYIGSDKNVKIRHDICGNIFEVTPDNFKKGNRCNRKECKCKRIANALKLSYDEVKSRIESVDGYKLLSDTYVNSMTKIKILHDECGSIYEVTFNNFMRGKRCPHCANLKRSKFLNGSCESKACKKIEKYLINKNIQFEKEYKFDDLTSDKNYYLRFDFAIFKNNKLFLLIEYDGLQHFKYNKKGFFTEKQYLRLKENDNLKDAYCINNNITFYRIDYKSDKTIEKDIEQILQLEDYWSSTTIETTSNL